MDNFNIHKYLKKEYLSESVDDESAEYYFDYLNKLRDSGVTNMFGAGSYLQAVFGLDKGTAREILAKWMKSMNEDRKAKEYIKSIEDEDEREEERKRMFDNDELDEVELTQDFGELDEDHTKRENDQLKKISKQLKKSVKSHAKQSKIIDKIVKEIKDSQIKISKPRYIKDKNNPNFLNIYIDYSTGGGGALIALGKETMSGQIRRKSAAAAVDKLNNIAKDLTSKYDVEDIEVTDLENGTAKLFAVSDDFMDVRTTRYPGINEIDMNDPVVMRARASRDEQPEPTRGGLDFEDVMY